MSSRQRALRSGREHTLKLKDIPPIPDRCPVLGIKLVVGADWANRLSAPSLDRVDNTKGYVPGNVQVLSLRANNMKNDSTIEELELVLAYMKAHAA